MKTTSDPGFLTIRMDVPKGRRWSGDVPVEIRDAKTFALKARSVPGSKVGVPEGKYWVGAILPDGQQISSDDLVDVCAGETKEIELKWTDLDVPGSLEQGTLVYKPVKAVADFAAPVWQWFTGLSAARVRGNWLAARLKFEPEPPPRRERISNLTLETRLSDLPVILEITSASEIPSYFAVPVDGENGRTTAAWEVDNASGQVNVHFDFHDGELNTFFDYVQKGGNQEARSISRTLIGQAEKYAEEQKSPLRAVLAAYVLLRANEDEGLGDWSERLCSKCEWLPDGVAVRIEYLAREGKHMEAAELMPELAQRGAPWFRSGVAYVASRAKLYSSVRRSTSTKTKLEDRKSVV